MGEDALDQGGEWTVRYAKVGSAPTCPTVTGGELQHANVYIREEHGLAWFGTSTGRLGQPD